MWLTFLCPFVVHFILIKPVLSDYLSSYVTLFQCSLGQSHKKGLTVYPRVAHFNVQVILFPIPMLLTTSHLLLLRNVDGQLIQNKVRKACIQGQRGVSVRKTILEVIHTHHMTFPLQLHCDDVTLWICVMNTSKIQLSFEAHDIVDNVSTIVVGAGVSIVHNLAPRALWDSLHGFFVNRKNNANRKNTTLVCPYDDVAILCLYSWANEASVYSTLTEAVWGHVYCS